MKQFFVEFSQGGPFMFIILTVSVVALGLMIYKAYLLWFKQRLAVGEVTRAIIRQVEASNYARAIQYCNSKAHPLTNILKAVLLRANKPEKEIRRAVEVSAAEEVPRFRKITGVLPHLSNVATMLGLLGTIRGLIIAFSGMEAGDAVKRQEALSTGIAIAFRTTFFGLSVAVALITAYIILSTKQSRMLAEMEYSATAVVDAIVTKNNKKMAAARPGLAQDPNR